MSIEQTNVIDFIGTNKTDGYVTLTISDHLDWNDSQTHLLLLQEKLNSYLAFCESGEIFQTYPQAKDKDIIIKIYAKYQMNQEGEFFFEQAREIVEEAGFELHFSLLQDDSLT